MSGRLITLPGHVYAWTDEYPRETLKWHVVQALKKAGVSTIQAKVGEEVAGKREFEFKFKFAPPASFEGWIRLEKNRASERIKRMIEDGSARDVRTKRKRL